MTPKTSKTYRCDDGGDTYDIVAESPEAAAREYVDGGDYDQEGLTETSWVRVWVQEVAADDADEQTEAEWEAITVAVDPQPPECEPEDDASDWAHPECEREDGHDWHSPHDVLGGISENPGIWGHGGGVLIKEVCADCGIYRRTDTWAQNPETGEQGLRAVTYESADDASLEYARSQRPHRLRYTAEELDEGLMVVTATCLCGRDGTFAYHPEDEADDGVTEIDRDCPALVALDQDGWPMADELASSSAMEEYAHEV